MKKRPWTPEENARLLALAKSMTTPEGASWASIATHMERTPSACSSQFFRLTGPVKTGRKRSHSIDLGLAVISAVTPPGHVWHLQDIAEVCGCSQQAISLIEQKALTKLRRHAQRLIA